MNLVMDPRIDQMKKMQQEKIEAAQAQRIIEKDAFFETMMPPNEEDEEDEEDEDR